MEYLFTVSINDESNRREILKKALVDGRIACDTNRIQNIFSIKADNQSKIIESWQKCYPELSDKIECWKYAIIDGDNETTHEEFKIFPVHRGKEMLCIFLGMFKTNTTNILRVVHLCAKLTFKVQHYGILDNFSFAERALMFILSDGISEMINISSSIVSSYKEKTYTRMLDSENSAKILAGIVLSDNYSQVRINWK